MRAWGASWRLCIVVSTIGSRRHRIAAIPIMAKKFACIGIANAPSKEKTPSYQQSCQLIPTFSTTSPICNHGGIASTTSFHLDDAILSCVAFENVVPTAEDAAARRELDGNDIEDGFDPAFQIYHSEDANLLRCRPTNNASATTTILGISEDHRAYYEEDNTKLIIQDIPVCLSIFEPCHKSIFDEFFIEETTVGRCCCPHPREDWKRCEERLEGTDKRSVNNELTRIANLDIIDFTKIQDLRRNNITESKTSYPCIDTPGRVFHFLRSILHCNNHGVELHCASPWVGMNSNPNANHVVALLVNHPYNHKMGSIGIDASEEFWDDVENKEIDELLQFRTGDAAPSYFLHSASRLCGDLIPLLKNKSSLEDTESNCSLRTTLLLVYRHLPPRDTLSHSTLGQGKTFKGCLLETYLDEARDSELVTDKKAEKTKIVKHRMISPPYLSYEQEYPGILDFLLKSIDTIRNEARTIPRWTAWPEKSHYADNSWSVFPLCYTFPANDIEKRIFVDHTCSFVPETMKLLQTLGPILRTALFSRLDAGSRLGAHTGWEDLANHVLRIHIPLIVPGNTSTANDNTSQNADNYNMGLCGVWVDGCVDTHEEGRIIVFDDSKVHRAFNYSNGERVVLIIDLARPQGLPIGTATGGHSDELDDFISGF